MIAEDDADIRETLLMLLELEGFTVCAVEDGWAVINAVLATEFQAAVLDVHMPSLDGLTAAKFARRVRPALRLIVHTALDEEAVRKKFDGYDAYFRKPADLTRFVAKLAELLH